MTIDEKEDFIMFRNPGGILTVVIGTLISWLAVLTLYAF